jgi:succinate dehydrogenase hydrophobic anchor subunit
VSIRQTKLWSWHVIAGVVLLVLVGLHMAMMHLNGILDLVGFNPYSDEPIAWANVLFRAQQVAFAVIYVLVLAAGLYHGLYGTRTILFELNPSPGLRTAITWTFLVVGIGLFIFGSWAAIASRVTALALMQ